MGYALILRNTSFVLALDIFYTLKGYVTCAVDTYFAATLDKLDNPDTLIGCCGLGGVGRSLLMPDGVGYGLGGVRIRQAAISVGACHCLLCPTGKQARHHTYGGYER